MDYYRVSAETFEKEYYIPMIQRFGKKVNHLKHSLNLTDEDLSHHLWITLQLEFIKFEPMLWYICNYELGGMLDDYDDARKKNFKKLQSFCNHNFNI